MDFVLAEQRNSAHSLLGDFSYILISFWNSIFSQSHSGGKSRLDFCISVVSMAAKRKVLASAEILPNFFTLQIQLFAF